MPSTRSRCPTRSKSPSSSSSSGSSSSSSDEEPNTVVNMRKRPRRSSKKRSRKRSCKDKNSKTDPYHAFRKFASWYLRSEHAFTDYCNVFTYGLWYEARQFGKLTREKFAVKHATELECYFAMKDQIPSFDNMLEKLKEDAEQLNDLGKLMNDAAGLARGNDIKSLLDKGLAYLALDLPGKALDPSIPSTSVKEQTRGHNHTVLSRLLTPVRLQADFDKNPEEFHKKILRGAVKFNDEDFPSLLYPQPDGYDPDDLEANLLRNSTAARFFKHIFTSPLSATRDLGTKPKRKTGQAKIHKMTEVTPASIAYSYLMFWYNISALGDWRTDDDLMDRSELYLMIIGLFEEREDDDEATIQWRKDTLDWWNLAVFGIVPDKSDDESDDQTKATTLQLLREQRTRKAAAAAAAPASTVAPEAEASTVTPEVSASVTSATSTTAAASTTTSSSSSTASPNPSTPSEARSANASELPDARRLAPPSSPSLTSSFPPIHIPQVATPPRSSPAANSSPTASRQPLTPARHANTMGSVASPVLRPVKYSRNRNLASAPAPSTDHRSRR